ncbi:MAG: rhodanese-like domain-containing protein [Bdellovibrionales bacterium]|nr:rhodanese-like domain-containing protein [Bdellovibrionales bacterium]
MTKTRVDFSSKMSNPHFPGVVDISPEELFEKRSHVKLIDVRESREFTDELGHIHGAELITLNLIPEKIGEVPRDTTVVFICRSGGRSAQATAFALENGFSSVYNMKGGMLLWNQLGFETEGGK